MGLIIHPLSFTCNRSPISTGRNTLYCCLHDPGITNETDKHTPHNTLQLKFRLTITDDSPEPEGRHEGPMESVLRMEVECVRM